MDIYSVRLSGPKRWWVAPLIACARVVFRLVRVTEWPTVFVAWLIKHGLKKKTVSLRVHYLYRLLPDGELAGGAVAVVFTLKGQPMFCEIIKGKSSSPYTRQIQWQGSEVPLFDDFHWTALEAGTKFGCEVAP